jgi:hypothetical protein
MLSGMKTRRLLPLVATDPTRVSSVSTAGFGQACVLEFKWWSQTKVAIGPALVQLCNSPSETGLRCFAQ